MQEFIGEILIVLYMAKIQNILCQTEISALLFAGFGLNT